MDFIDALYLMKADPNRCTEMNRGGITTIYKLDLKDMCLKWWDEVGWNVLYTQINNMLGNTCKIVPDPSIKPMSFMEAVEECDNGKDIRRKAWTSDLRIKSKNRDKLIIQSVTLSSRTASLDWSDIIANDWETIQ